LRNYVGLFLVVGCIFLLLLFVYFFVLIKPFDSAQDVTKKIKAKKNGAALFCRPALREHPATIVSAKELLHKPKVLDN